jgi:hypothetical protein
MTSGWVKKPSELFEPYISAALSMSVTGSVT